MADAGEVKAKVTIEYDGSGIKQAKEDLASLAQAAGSAGENAGQAGEKMAELDAQMSGSAESARGFSSALGELPKIAEGGTSTISEMTSALSEHQTVIAETGSAYEGLKKPVEATVTMLQDVAPQMQVISKNAQSMQEQMSSASEGFTQISTSVSQVAPLLPQYAESMHAVSESFNPSAFGLDDFVRNTEVFQEALSNPAPFSMMKEHLLETGQTWSDFTSSLSESDAAMFSEMAQRTSGSYQVLDKAAGSAQKAGAAFTEAANGANDFTAQFLGMNDAAVETNKSIKETGAILEETGKSSGGGGGLFGGLFGGAAASEDVVSPFMGFLNDVMMPLMAVQMVGYAFSAVGQAIYDSAAIAEGPAAHSYGSFTGAVDTMSASVNKAKQTFAEGFGQGTLPFLEGMNNANNNPNGGIDWGSFGYGLGIETGVVGDILGLVGGGILSGAAKVVTLNPNNDFGNNIWQGSLQGLANTWASLTGQEMPYPGPAPTSTPAQLAYQQQMAAMPQQLAIQTATLNAQANDPEFLAAQAGYQSAYAKAVKAQAMWDTSHYTGTTGPTDWQNEILQYQAVRAAGGSYGTLTDPNAVFFGWNDYLNGNAPTPGTYRGLNYSNSGGNFSGGGGGPSDGSFGTAIFGELAPASSIGDWGAGLSTLGKGISGLFSGIGDLFTGNTAGKTSAFGSWWDNLFGGGGDEAPVAGPVPISSGGCFVAGTPVLLADGSEKPIETLRVDEQVLAYDGKNQIQATIIGCISFPAKQTYELVFDDGRTLVTTDSHPLAGVDGWKSISPASTALENPGLPVTTLQVGDSIYTVNGLCRLMSIQKREITTVYNITVDTVHTYYAGGILVHNAKQGNTIGSGSLANDGTGSEQVQVSHTFVAQVSWEANNLQKQFTGAASWVGQNLSNMFTGAASWVGQNLANTFQGAADWVGQGLSNTFHGAADWVGTGLSNTFKGIASWVGQGLEHTFTGSASWIGQNLNPTFTVNPSFTMLAEGTSNWPGGPAIVGEGGAPEVVEHNGQYSLIDRATLLNLPQGANVYPMKNLQSSGVAQFADGTGGYMLPITLAASNGNNMPQSINVNVHLDSQTILSAIEMPFAQNIRVASGLRSY